MKPRIQRFTSSLATSSLLVFGTPTAALDTHFSSFGTLSASCLSDDTADYVINDQPEGAGRTRRCDAGIDSLLGAQLDLGLSKTFQFGLQMVVDRNADRTFTPAVTVAQLRWQPTDALTLRLGRMPTPVFLHSEDRLVRYAMPWVRPPLEVYGLVPTFSQDGLEIIYKSSLGGWSTEWDGGAASIDFDSPQSNTYDTFPVDARNGFINFSIRDANTLIKLSYNYFQVSISQPDVDALLNLLRRFGGPSGAQLADDLAIDDAPSHQVSIGVRHERGNWLAISELGYRTIDGYFRDQYGAYATVGRRFGPWMPYVTLARRWTSGPKSDNRAGIFQPQVEALLAATRFDTTSASLGLSREIGEHATVKFQADWIRPDNDSWGLFTNHGPDYNYANPGSDWLFTLSLDFIF